MQNEDVPIPLPVVRPLIGYFNHTSGEQERDALDEWICADDANMQVFEECLELTLRPRQARSRPG